MKQFIEKMIGRLEEYKYSHLIEHDSEECLHCQENEDDWCNCRDCSICVWDKAVEIVNQLAEEYRQDLDKNSQGWISCSERLPKELKTKDGHIDPSEEVLVYIYYGKNCVSNGYAVSRYWSHSENHPNPWIDLKFGSENVVAWKPIATYQPKGDNNV